METYNYLEAVKSDVKNVVINEYEYINEIQEDREGFEARLNEELWINDSVTGNGSGSYTFSTWKAEEYLCHNLDLLAEACEEFGNNIDILKDGAEACDITIRCYLLARAISEVLDELEEEIEKGEIYDRFETLEDAIKFINS